MKIIHKEEQVKIKVKTNKKKIMTMTFKIFDHTGDPTENYRYINRLAS